MAIHLPAPGWTLLLHFPEDCTISTEEILENAGTGQEILVNNGVSNEAQYKAAEFTTTYDFMVILPDQSSIVQMLHEKCFLLQPFGKSMSAEQYLDSVKAQLGALEDYGYEFNDYEDVNIGGQTFYENFSVSALGGAMLQDYYCISKGKYISSIIASYIPDSTETIEAVMAGVTTSK